jgi:hypothetical protein
LEDRRYQQPRLLCNSYFLYSQGALLKKLCFIYDFRTRINFKQRALHSSKPYARSSAPSRRRRHRRFESTLQLLAAQLSKVPIPPLAGKRLAAPFFRGNCSQIFTTRGSHRHVTQQNILQVDPDAVIAVYAVPKRATGAKMMRIEY